MAESCPELWRRLMKPFTGGGVALSPIVAPRSGTPRADSIETENIALMIIAWHWWWFGERAPDREGGRTKLFCFEPDCYQVGLLC